MSTLGYNEKIILSDVFNQGGYVLDLSTPKFDRFTFDSIGEALCSKYELSKGKSLEKFLDEGEVNCFIAVDDMEKGRVLAVNAEPCNMAIVPTTLIRADMIERVGAVT